MTNICACGRLVTDGRTGDGNGNTQCIVCQTARALGTPIPRKIRRAPVEFVRGRVSGIRGRIKRRVWLIDLKTNAPAELAYVVKFDDGRELRVSPDDVEKVAR